MAAVYEIANFKDSIATSDLIDEEEKANLNKQIEVLEQYEQLAFYLIKSCNDFVIKLSGGAFKDGFLFSYDTIVNELSEDAGLIEKFNSVKVNLDAPREKIENAEIKNVINVLNEPSPVAQGITLKKFERPLVPLNIVKPIVPKQVIPRSFRGVQAAGSYKAGHIRKRRITRGRAVNKNKKTKQRKQRKSRKYTRRAL